MAPLQNYSLILKDSNLHFYHYFFNIKSSHFAESEKKINLNPLWNVKTIFSCFVSCDYFVLDIFLVQHCYIFIINDEVFNWVKKGFKSVKINFM